MKSGSCFSFFGSFMGGGFWEKIYWVVIFIFLFYWLGKFFYFFKMLLEKFCIKKYFVRFYLRVIGGLKMVYIFGFLFYGDMGFNFFCFGIELGFVICLINWMMWSWCFGIFIVGFFYYYIRYSSEVI